MNDELVSLLHALDGVRQSPKYHPEGDALYHTMQVFGLALRETGAPDKELRLLADAWAERAINTFLSGYADVDEVHRLLPQARASRDALLSVFEMDKAVYEVAYEMAHRPSLVDLPIRAVERLLDYDDDLPDRPPDEEDLFT